MGFQYSFPGSVGEVTAEESVVLEYCARSLYFNIDSRELYLRFDTRTPIRRWEGTVGDQQRIRLYIVNEEQEDTELIELPAGVSIIFAAVSAFGDDPLVECTEWTPGADSDGSVYYEGILDFDTVELKAAMNYGTGTEDTRLDLLADIKIIDGAAKITSGTITLRVWNTASREDGDTPTTLALHSGFQFKSSLSSSSQATSETALAALATEGLATGKIIVLFLVGDEPQHWILLAGTAADVAGFSKRPTDYHGTTNAKYWKRIA